MHCDIEDTSLLVYVDGDLKLFEKAREYVRMSQFKDKLCVYRKKGLPNISHMASRRKRIGDIHKEIAGYLSESSEFILLVEDDTVIPPHTIDTLMHTMLNRRNVGFVSGVELGRWGFTHIGAWLVDNLEDPQEIVSIANTGGLVKVSAAGFYCCLTRRVNYIRGDFNPFDKILGPDFSYGLNLKREGFSNYVNFDVKCVHKTAKEDIHFENNEIIQVKFDKIEGSKLGYEMSTL